MAVSTSAASEPIITTNGANEEKKNQMKGSEASQRQQTPPPICSPPAKRTKCAGVRVVGGRIYDSENGKTCHQCRQKTMDFVAQCKNQRNGKPCSIKFCHKCLLNRYGEKAEEMAVLDDWTCPKCRGICNCSFCMKKRGHRPTGILVHTAKATGFCSVSEMLKFDAKSPKNLNPEKIKEEVNSSPKKPSTLNKDPTITSTRKRGKEAFCDDKSASNLRHKSLTVTGDVKNTKKPPTSKEVLEADICLPQDPTTTTTRKHGTGNLDKENCNSHRTHKSLMINGDLKDTKNPSTSSKDPNVTSTRNRGKENLYDGNCNSNLTQEPLRVNGDVKNTRKNNQKELQNQNRYEKSDRGSKDDGAVSNKSHKKYQISTKISERGCPTNRKGDDDKLEKMICQENVSKETFLDPMKNEEKISKRDVSISACHKEQFPYIVDISITGAEPKPVPESCELKSTTRIGNNDSDIDIPLPKGTDLTTVAGIDFHAEDVGNVLQFLEFCTAFGRVLRLRRGDPESLLRDLMRRSTSRFGHCSSISWFHIQLLSLIQKDMGEKAPLSQTRSDGLSWLKAIGRYISKSRFASKELPSDCFVRCDDGYGKLDFSEKLILLNFLCDEALGTVKLRNWIDEQNSKFVEREKEAKEKLLAAKEKEKSIKRKLQNELAEAIILKNGAPLSVSEHEGIVSRIKVEATQAHAETLEAMGLVPKMNFHLSQTILSEKQRSDAVRTEPICLDGDGSVYWRLKGYSGEPNVLLQDVRKWDSVTAEEKWLKYNVEQAKELEMYFSSSKKRKTWVSHHPEALLSKA